MVSFAEVKALIAAQWGLAPGVAAPTVYDMDLRYDITYPNVVFLKMYADMPIKAISQSNNEGLTLRKQNFLIKGVYVSYATAKVGMQELKRIMTEKKGYYIGGTGKGSIIQTALRHVYTLPCYEKAYLQKGEL